MQNFDARFTVQILEPIIVFLAYSRYELSTDPQFVAKLCDQHLQECLKKCLLCYDETQQLSASRCRVEAVYLIFNLGAIEALERAIRLPNEVKRDDIVKTAIEMSLHHWRRNFYKVIQLMKGLPDFFLAVATIRLNETRRYVFLLSL